MINIYVSQLNSKRETINELDAIGSLENFKIVQCTAFNKVVNVWAFFDCTGKQKTVAMSLTGWMNTLKKGLVFNDILTITRGIT